MQVVVQNTTAKEFAVGQPQNAQCQSALRLFVRRKGRLNVSEIENGRPKTRPGLHTLQLTYPRHLRVSILLRDRQQEGIILFEDDENPAARGAARARELRGDRLHSGN